MNSYPFVFKKLDTVLEEHQRYWLEDVQKYMLKNDARYATLHDEIMTLATEIARPYNDDVEERIVGYSYYIELLSLAYLNIGRSIAMRFFLMQDSYEKSSSELRELADENFNYFLSHSPFPAVHPAKKALREMTDLKLDYYDPNMLKGFLKKRAEMFLRSRYLFCLIGFEQTVAECHGWDDSFCVPSHLSQVLTDAFTVRNAPIAMLSNHNITLTDVI